MIYSQNTAVRSFLQSKINQALSIQILCRQVKKNHALCGLVKKTYQNTQLFSEQNK